MTTKTVGVTDPAPRYNDAMLDMHGERYQRLKLNRYGISFEEYLEDPFGYETVLQLPDAMRKRLMDAAAGAQPQLTPIAEMLQMANTAAYQALCLEQHKAQLEAEKEELVAANRRLYRELCKVEQVAREKELVHNIAMLHGVEDFRGSVLLTARLNLQRYLRRKDMERHANAQSRPALAAAQAQP